MKRLINTDAPIGVRILFVAVFALAILPVPLVRADGNCGCMDVALVIDNTASMGGAINNVMAELPNIVAAAQAASGGDLRMGLVTFPANNVVVDQPFTNDVGAIQNAITAITLGAPQFIPESSDESLQYVITGAAESSCTVVATNGPFGTFRSGCVKIAVLVTDAPPGGCHDTFTVGVDDVHAHAVAIAAARAGVLVASIYVPTTPELATEAKNILLDYADISGGVFVETSADGTGTGQGIADIVAECGTAGSQECTTRNARFWFTHAIGTDPNCVSLVSAIETNGSTLDLGFIHLPTTYYTGSSLTSTDALIEALSFYWRSTSRTGDGGGASLLCRARKLLAVELIAATANVKLLGTRPSGCTYNNGGTTTNFPANLLPQAFVAAIGEDVAADLAMTDLLQKFNSSGLTNGFPSGLFECNPGRNSALKKISIDPTTKLNCPGKNDQCDTAEAVSLTFNPNTFRIVPFKRTVNTSTYDLSSVIDLTTSNVLFSGHLVWYKVTPDVGTSGRQFTANTDGSNFDTMLTIWHGPCAALTLVASNDDSSSTNQGRIVVSKQARVQFQTDGTNTYYIVLGNGASGGYGKAKISVTSP